MKRKRRIDEIPEHRGDALTRAMIDAHRPIFSNKRPNPRPAPEKNRAFCGVRNHKPKAPTLPQLNWPRSKDDD